MRVRYPAPIDTENSCLRSQPFGRNTGSYEA